MKELIRVKGNIPNLNINDENKNKSLFELAINYFKCNDVSIYLDGSVLLEFNSNSTINIFFINHLKSKRGVISKQGKLTLTPMGESLLKGNSLRDNIIKSLENVVMKALRYLYYVFVLTNYPQKDKSYKIIKANDFTKINMKDTKLEIIVYPKLETENMCIARDKGDKVEILNTFYNRKKWTIPSTYYPLDGRNYKVFTTDNTTDLNDHDKLANMLDNLIFKQGYCYTNSTKIVEALKDYDGKVEFYSGWVFIENHLTHHAWVVVNDNSIIDVSFRYAMFKILDDMRHTEEEGLIYEGKSPIDILAEDIVSDKPFKEKYLYGKVSRECVYVGVPSDASTAINTFNTLMAKVPNHPEYQNIKEDGSNSTLENLYKKLYSI